MLLWQNIPFFCIMAAILSAALCSVLPGKVARVWSAILALLIMVASGVLTVIMYTTGTESFTFKMGHFPAPWGNEIRVGILECTTAIFFFAVMFISIIGGADAAKTHILPDKRNLYSVVICLLSAALLVMIYTNDLFTGYVFLEIMTLAACALIMARSKGRTLVAAARYMILNLLGSGLFLLGVCLLYDLTGHLLMSDIRGQVMYLEQTPPLVMAIGCMAVGLAIKSGLFPFHTWLPDAYGYSTPTSAAFLSSLVSKGYIFLLIKIFCRVISLEVIRHSGIHNVFFVLGNTAIVMGSFSAIREKDIRRMISFSSVAQIGYIYAAIGLGTQEGLIAAMFQVFAHAAAKSMLFISAGELSRVSGDSKLFRDLRGSAYRSKWAGLAFIVGAFSMTGIPFFGGFIVKILLGDAAMQVGGFRAIIALLALAASAALNTVYFLKTVITIYRREEDGPTAVLAKAPQAPWLTNAAMFGFIVLNFILGVFSQPVVWAIRVGFDMFF